MEKEITEELNGYLWIKGKFNYGGRNKTYGLVNLFIDLEKEKLMDLKIAMVDKVIELGLGSNLNFFLETLDKIKTDYRSQKAQEQLVSNFKASEIVRLLGAVDDNSSEVAKEIFKEKLEDITQEAINFKVKTKLFSRDELEESYPKLFDEDKKEVESQTEDETIENDQETKLDARIELKCSPVISAVAGKRITDLQLQDELVVQVKDDRDIGQDIAELLQKQGQDKVVGTIEEIKHDQELDRYHIVVKFKRNIYGKLVVDPEVKLTITEESRANVESREKSDSTFNLDQEELVLFAILGLIVIVIIILFLVI
ncbi:hypothetical protein [Halobacteroides halobius]|nr:hypothetical protein [Halobacteroides halobius]